MISGNEWDQGQVYHVQRTNLELDNRFGSHLLQESGNTLNGHWQRVVDLGGRVAQSESEFDETDLRRCGSSRGNDRPILLERHSSNMAEFVMNMYEILSIIIYYINGCV